MTARVLRSVAVLIAVAGIADPVLSTSRFVRPQLTITILTTPTLALPASASTRVAHAYQSAATLSRALESHYDVTVREQSPAADADPCGSHACIVISDGARPATLLTQPRLLGAVKIGAPIDRNVRIAGVTAPATTDVRALAALDVQLDARGIGAATTDIDVFDGAVPVGHATHRWTSPVPPSPATVRVEWTPIAEGVRELRIVARSLEEETTGLDNDATIAVAVTTRERAVVFHEAEPTWAGTFVRRALSSDPRFRVLASAHLGGPLVTTSAGVRLESSALAQHDVATVVVSKPQRLAQREVSTLEQFARVGGGTVVLLVDAPPAGRLTALWPGGGAMHVEQEPSVIGPLKSSEFVTFNEIDEGTSVLAAARSGPVVVSRRTGAGRIVLSGAADAWRFRDDENRFDHFWQGLVADAVTAAGDALMVSLSPGAVRAGDRVGVTVEQRTADANRAIDARATLVCNATETMVRLWPSNAPGQFRGEFRAPASGRCALRAQVDGARAMAPLVVGEHVGLGSDRDDLSAAIVAVGGSVVAEGDEASLLSAFQQSAPREAIATLAHPLRSPWWIVPFAACLGGEWWLRRRAGHI